MRSTYASSLTYSSSAKTLCHFFTSRGPGTPAKADSWSWYSGKGRLVVLVLQPRQARAPGTLAETPTSGGPPGGPVAPARGTPWLGSAARDEPLRWTSVTLQGPPWPSPNPPEEPPGWAPQPGVSPSYGPPCTQRAALVPGLTRPKHPLAAHMFQHSPSAGAHAFQNLGFSYCAKGSRPNRVKQVRTEEERNFAPPILVR